MGMVVRTNTMALNAYRQLGMNNSAVSKSLEKLSSGFRINRAGDDAAGLAISEKMKAQITGLETASANAQDGISLIQTAEGNLSEVHTMLNRMVELATKSANGTYTTTERSALQDEVDSLLDEIDRISQSANFNGTKLLNGTMGLNSTAFTVGNTVDVVKPQTSVGDGINGATITANHANTGTTQAEQKPSLTIDLADLEFTQAADGATPGKIKWTVANGITINGTALTFVKDAATSTTTAPTKTDIEGTAAGDKDTAAELKGSEIVTGLLDTTNGAKHVVVDNEVFELSGNGTSLTLTWVGKVSGGKLDNTAKVDDATVTTWNKINKGNVVIANATASAGTGTVTAENRDNCHLTSITDAKKETAVVRAGASLKLTTDMIQVGAKLKIGETEFQFVDKKEADAASGEIGIKDIASADLLEAVTRQLSNQGNAVIKDADGNSFNFVIGRGNATDTIEIEEAVQSDPDDYSKFTADQLKKAFSYTTAPTMASIDFTLNNGNLNNGDAITIGGTTYKFTDDGAGGTVKIGADATETLNNLKTAMGSTYDVTVNGSTIKIAGKTVNDTAPVISGGGLTLQIGDTADPFNKMTVTVADMSAKGLGLEDLRRTNGGILTETSASEAIDIITKAINTVSTTRAGMGALQNRLEHTINNLDVAAENLSAANSRIRDTDMAKEMMNYTKMNVLVQSAQAMLAQANQQPQSVLQLLQ